MLRVYRMVQADGTTSEILVLCDYCASEIRRNIAEMKHPARLVDTAEEPGAHQCFGTLCRQAGKVSA